MRRVVISLVSASCLAGWLSWAQSGSEFQSEQFQAFGTDDETPPATRVAPRSSPANAKRRAENPVDLFSPGWRPDYQHGLGWTSAFSDGFGSLVYETGLGGGTGWAYYVGLDKDPDTFATSITNSTSGSPATSVSTTETRSGNRQPFVLSLGIERRTVLYRSSFLITHFGWFGGIDYYTTVKEPTGTKSSSYNPSTPTTVTLSESAFGERTISRAPVLRIGPTVAAFAHLRWFPNLLVGFQGGVLLQTNKKVTTKTSTVSRSYQVISGVEQTPTSYSTNRQESTVDSGLGANTVAVGGQSFNLFGSFVLRYVW